MSTPLTSQETFRGFIYMAFEIILLPVLLQAGNQMLGGLFTESELNFLFFLINFLAIIIIFHRFLGKSFREVTRHPIYCMQAVILGLAGYFACKYLFDQLISWFRPGFVNLNDQGIASLARQGRFLMVIGTVILVPPVEECLYRGLIFKKLYDTNPWVGYIVSMLAFAAIHLIGFVGSLSLWDLLICLVQYLPAGLLLSWVYVKADTIYAPILMHGLINFWAIRSLR